MVSSQFLRFVLVSTSNVAINAVCFFGLVHVGAHYLVASAVGWFVGVVISFFLNRNFTFQASAHSWLPQFGRYLAGYVAQLVIAWIIYIVCLQVVRLDVVVAYVINLILLPVLNFAYMRVGVFAGLDKAKKRGEV